ncbi:MAG: 3'-5' exonuclease domain-containing protein 2 [Bacteroidales bacterium]|nr:3'-5' exonuclease domain-containing protein 2 [Bacteroidales bacterium]
MQSPTEDYLIFNGKIIIVSEENPHFDEAINFLKKQTLVGFDTETRPSFKKGVSNKTTLIQFATNDTAILFRLIKHQIPNDLIPIFENPNILKVGVGCSQDIQQLQKLKKFSAKGFIDIQTIAKSKGIDVLSLRKLSEKLFNKKISKRQQLSNWESKELTEAQIRYAATDAYAALLIYQKLLYELPSDNTQKK